MARCDTDSSAKACSGKCRANACHSAPRVWVVAACEGMVSLFEKQAQGTFIPVPCAGHVVFASLDQFQQSLDEADGAHAFDQLVIIGSPSDIAWIHASLPHTATHRIAAEIAYPLLPVWFKQPMPLVNLTQALERVFTA